MDREVILTAEELTKRYGSQTAVNHLNLTIGEGEVFGFLGPNGAGKTTSILMFSGTHGTHFREGEGGWI